MAVLKQSRNVPTGRRRRPAGGVSCCPAAPVARRSPGPVTRVPGPPSRVRAGRHPTPATPGPTLPLTCPGGAPPEPASVPLTRSLSPILSYHLTRPCPAQCPALGSPKTALYGASLTHTETYNESRTFGHYVPITCAYGPPDRPNPSHPTRGMPFPSAFPIPHYRPSVPSTAPDPHLPVRPPPGPCRRLAQGCRWRTKGRAVRGSLAVRSAARASARHRMAVCCSTWLSGVVRAVTCVVLCSE